jgi:hypothetical protein
MIKYPFILLSVLLCVLFAGAAQAQGSLSNLRSRVLQVTGGCYALDSLTVAPSSVQVRDAVSGELMSRLLYRLEDNRICFALSGMDTLALQVDFRVLPYRLSQRIFRMDTLQLRTADDAYRPMAIGQISRGIVPDGLTYQGSFTRGLSFGNSQDLVLNSSFNLQMTGRLSDGIEVRAAISDDNIPLQPEGNTRQLREFDRVFIQLSKGKGSLTAGDYDLQRPRSYFMNYFKRLQGLSFRTEAAVPGTSGRVRADASVAVSRGQFARNQIRQQEGNQGPYRLRGAQGELFIIVLAGTEKVWLDGQLMERGIETDYIIDYNRGELSFTNKRLITKDSRIIVEFEYADQGYLRTLYAMNTEYLVRDTRFYFHVYGQQDSRTSQGGSLLSPEQRRLLREAGDEAGLALSPSLDTVAEFLPYRVQYRLVDTLGVCGQADSVLVFSTDPQQARYTARFSFVGPGNGHYVLDADVVANERVYRWVSPDPQTCRPRGDFAPVVQLAAPQAHQLMTLGGEHQFGRRGMVQTELALSHRDRNRFSDLNSADNSGLAWYTRFRRDILPGGDSTGWGMAVEGAYEWVHRNFSALNPYRPPEFLRDWSLTDIQGIGELSRADEHLGNVQWRLRRVNFGDVSYGFSAFLRDSIYRGMRHQMALQFDRAGWKLDAQASMLDARQVLRRDQFIRSRAELRRTIASLGGWQLGWLGEQERNSRRDIGTDTLSAASFNYDIQRAFVASPAGNDRYTVGMHWQRRQDYVPYGQSFVGSTAATEWNLHGSRQIKRVLQLSGNFSWRRLTDGVQEAAEHVLGRADANLALWRGALRTNTTYELGSGQEPRQEFTYIRVRQGEGTHIWQDSLNNNDGIIQPNEMELAPFADQADFIRVPTVSNEFIRVDYASLLQSIQLEPRAVWFKEEGMRGMLSRLSLQSTLKASRRTRDAEAVQSWNPLQWAIPDTALVAINTNSRHVLFINRGHARWDVSLGHTDVWNKVVQTTGYEDRRTQEDYVRGRYTLSKQVNVQAGISRSVRGSDSEFFQNRDFRIRAFSVEPQGNWQPTRFFRLTAKYRYQTDTDVGVLTDRTFAERHDLSSEAQFNQAGSWLLRARLSWVQIDFSGVAASPVGFAILNGLQPGRNWLWNLGFDRQLAKNLQLGFSYEGRQTGSGRLIHLGRASVGAIF